MRTHNGGTIDIETYPGTYRAFADNMYEAKLMREDKPIRLASVVYKELGTNKVIVLAEWQFKKYRAFLEAVWRICDSNEHLVGHNAKEFDLKQLNAFFAAHGFKKPRCKIVDTLTAVRRNFRLPSYRLKYVLQYFGIGEKLETGGETLWFKVEAGDETARRHFLKYNKNDTLQTEKLYLYLVELGYITVPEERFFVLEDGCPRCGSHKLQSRGERPLADGWHRQYCCEECGKRPTAREVSRPYKKRK